MSSTLDTDGRYTYDEWCAEVEQRYARGQGWFSALMGEVSPSGLPLNSYSVALEASRVVKAGAGTCYGVSAYSNKGSAQFILIFDTDKTLANGMLPCCPPIAIAATANAAVFWGFPTALSPFGGRSFQRGIQVANSSTAASLTLGSADCWFDVQYV